MNERRYKRPESVLVVIYTLAGEVLLLRRCQPPDFWQSVTGSLEWEETDPAVTAQREVREETGLSGDGLELVDRRCTNRFPIKPEWRRRYDPTVTENTEYVFTLALPAPLPVQLHPGEHCEYVWLPRDAAAARASSYTNRDAILQFVPTGTSELT